MNYDNNINNNELDRNNFNDKQILLYINENKDVNKTMKNILQTPRIIMISSLIIGGIGLVGLIFIIYGIVKSNLSLDYMFGSILIAMSILIFAVGFLNIYIHNNSVNRFIKSNINKFMHEISGNYYYINHFNTYFTYNYIICHYFNKKNIITYNDIAEVYTEKVGTGYIKSYNNYSILNALKSNIYDGLNNIVIKTKNNKKILIPSPNIDNQIYSIIFHKNNNVKFDIDINNINIQSMQSSSLNNKQNIYGKDDDENNDNSDKNQISLNAIYSILCGIVSIFIFWWLAVAGLSLGISALQEINTKNKKGKALAIFGLTICIISISLYLFYRFIK